MNYCFDIVTIDQRIVLTLKYWKYHNFIQRLIYLARYLKTTPFVTGEFIIKNYLMNNILGN